MKRVRLFIVGAMAVILALAAAAQPAATPAGVESAVIHDDAYGKDRPIWIYRTGAVDTRAQPYTLFVLIDGQAYLEELSVTSTLKTLTDAGKIGPAVAVMVGAASDRPADVANRAKFAEFMAAGLMPWLHTRLGRLPGPERVVIGGASFGGVTSAYVAFRHPELFGNVLAQSGAFWRGNEGTGEPAEWLTRQLRESKTLPIRFYVEVGALETHSAPNGVVFIEANRHLRDALVEKKYTVKYVEVPDAAHNPDHWRAALGAGIEYLAQPKR